MDKSEKPFLDNSNYLFCDKISFSIRASVINFVLNILVNANFKGN